MSGGRIFPEYMKLKDFAGGYISASVGTLRKWIKDGMPIYQVDRCIWIKISEFEEWFKQFRSGTKTSHLGTILAEVMAEVS